MCILLVYTKYLNVLGFWLIIPPLYGFYLIIIKESLFFGSFKYFFPSGIYFFTGFSACLVNLIAGNRLHKSGLSPVAISYSHINESILLNASDSSLRMGRALPALSMLLSGTSVRESLAHWVSRFVSLSSRGIAFFSPRFLWA